MLGADLEPDGIRVATLTIAGQIAAGTSFDPERIAERYWEVVHVDGPTAAPPAWATHALLTAAIDQAARAVRLVVPAAPGLAARTLGWGRELDTRPITTTGKLTDARVAAYVAKYATKAAECTGTLDRRLTPADQLDALPVRDHARGLIAECLRLAKLPGLERLRLARWAHMLGFGGHFSTKSRAYSITFGSLRSDRAAYQREQAITAGSLPDLDSDTTLVVSDWHFAGRPAAPSLRHTGGAV
jgi:hypothetical protein